MSIPEDYDTSKLAATAANNKPIRYWCKYCDFKTIYKYQLYDHVDEVHAHRPKGETIGSAGEKPDPMFERVNKIQVAMDEINERPLPYKCEDCGDSYEQYHACEKRVKHELSITKTINTREKTHGSYSVNSGLTQALLNIVSKHPDWAKVDFSKRQAISMIFLKISRIMSGDPEFIEHWHDIAGYATLIKKEINPEI